MLSAIDWKSFIAGIIAYAFIWPLIQRLIGGLRSKGSATS